MVLFLYVSDTHLSFNVNLVCLVLNGDMAGYTGIILGGVLGNFGEGSNATQFLQILIPFQT